MAGLGAGGRGWHRIKLNERRVSVRAEIANQRRVLFLAHHPNHDINQPLAVACVYALVYSWACVL